MNLAQIKNQLQNEGFCLIPNFMDAASVDKLKIICDDILQQWLESVSDSIQGYYIANMAFLTEPVYFKHHPYRLIELLELIADKKILEILNSIAGKKVLFHNTQYFFNPISKSWKGIWHRDTQFLAPEPELEKKRMIEATAVHFRIAFLKDSCLEYVPGSEQRWDTPEEYTMRKGENGKQQSSEHMPGKRRITLNEGDALLFHAWGIHRGIYDVNTPRRTLDIIYQWGKPCDYCPPPPTCFRKSDLLKQLSPSAQEFFSHFIKTYEKYWTE